ncbi:MAG TPA: S24 family peptidase [Fluviicoccus sp.]|nr:S24 family peptidase [Fluviicoccus sp.]
MKNLRDEEFGHGTVLQRIADAYAASSLADLIIKMDVPQKTLYGWKYRGTVPYEQVEKVAISKGVSLDWLMLGRGLPRNEEEKPSVRQPEELVMVPRYDVKASAGDGLLIHSEAVVDRLAFRREWISLMGLNPKRLAMIHVEGDSMEPTLFDNDIILINLDVTELKEDGVYVIQHRDVLRVKRIQNKMTGEVVIRSDNHAYESETLMPADAERLHVVGRVVWFGREL